MTVEELLTERAEDLTAELVAADARLEEFANALDIDGIGDVPALRLLGPCNHGAEDVFEAGTDA